nr:PREDICTED: sodium-dependent noradrenaline transporter-like [Bemisia tabaci]XP_018904110.1 PREDICTED: sodium-dependent noradrenaline transporter-like [Bemisia tabaci]
MELVIIGPKKAGASDGDGDEDGAPARVPPARGATGASSPPLMAVPRPRSSQSPRPPPLPPPAQAPKPQQLLDDGYGSSNSSPYSIVSGVPVGNSTKTSQFSGAGMSPFGVTQVKYRQDSSDTVSCLEPDPDDEDSSKRDMEVRLMYDDKYESFVILDNELVFDKVGSNGGPDGRETWESNADFLLSIIGFAVDLANVWRFPYLCYKNGGGAFLVPYTLMLVFGALPLFYMELSLGQYSRQGPISVWRICPLFKGVGFCAVLVAFYVSFYYNVIIGWSLYFLVASATPELPWLRCNNTWNTASCVDPHNTTARHNYTSALLPHSAASEYFHRAVLEMQLSSGLDQIGYPKWQLVLCVLCVYCMLYLSLFKGVKASGKVVWITATMPYVVLAILLVRGLMLPGALQGIVYYLKPEVSKLRDTQVWIDAAIQIFYSVGAGFGVHLSYASYNSFHNNCYRSCLVTTAVNCFTSFFSGLVIFTYLGFMSFRQGIPISSVATEGPGLVFQVYPEAVATLPGSQIWAMLFFFMLIMLGLDSAMGGMECVITGIMDEFFHDKRRERAREVFAFCAILVSFLVAIVNVTPGGIYVFHLFDNYCAGISLLCSALFEAIAVSWFYGLEKFSQDIEDMIGSKPGLYWRICWKFISPSFIIGVVMFDLFDHKSLEYNNYDYPVWAELAGWALALSAILMIPIVAAIQLIKTPGTLKERFAYCITPVDEHESLAKGKPVSRFKCRHWLYV